MAADYQRKVRHQIQDDIARGEDDYIHLTLTDTRAASNSTIATLDCLRLFWRRLTERFRRLYPDLAYLRALEFHKDGYPHLHLLIRSRSMMAAMMAEAGVASREQLRVAYQAHTTDPVDEHLFPVLFAKLADKARKSGFGHQVDVGPVVNLDAMPAELCKTTQISPSMARGVRRFQPSTSKIPGDPRRFFRAPPPVYPDRQPQTFLPIPMDQRVEGCTDMTLSRADDHPVLPISSDILTPEGIYRVQVVTAVLGAILQGTATRLELRLVICPGQGYDLVELPLCTVPEWMEADVRDLYLHAAGVHILPGASLDPALLPGQELTVHYRPPTSDRKMPALPGAGPIDEHGKTIFPKYTFLPKDTPTSSAIRPAQPIPIDAPLHCFEGDQPLIDSSQHELITNAIHFAPVCEVVAWYARDDLPRTRFCNAKFVLELDTDGSPQRRLVSCEEHLQSREGMLSCVSDINYLWRTLRFVAVATGQLALFNDAQLWQAEQYEAGLRLVYRVFDIDNTGRTRAKEHMANAS